MTGPAPTVIWRRREPRLADNPALAAGLPWIPSSPRSFQMKAKPGFGTLWWTRTLRTPSPVGNGWLAAERTPRLNFGFSTRSRGVKSSIREGTMFDAGGQSLRAFSTPVSIGAGAPKPAFSRRQACVWA